MLAKMLTGNIKKKKKGKSFICGKKYGNSLHVKLGIIFPAFFWEMQGGQLLDRQPQEVWKYVRSLEYFCEYR